VLSKDDLRVHQTIQLFCVSSLSLAPDSLIHSYRRPTVAHGQLASHFAADVLERTFVIPVGVTSPSIDHLNDSFRPLPLLCDLLRSSGAEDCVGELTHRITSGGSGQLLLTDPFLALCPHNS
jgi:hypothetical protein